MPSSGSASPAETISDLKTLLVDYAKQETIDPLRGIGRYLGFGLGGAVLVGTGVMLLSLAALRALQTETGDLFHRDRELGFVPDDLTWVPYLIVLVLLAVVIAVLARLITRGGER